MADYSDTDKDESIEILLFDEQLRPSGDKPLKIATSRAKTLQGSRTKTSKGRAPSSSGSVTGNTRALRSIQSQRTLSTTTGSLSRRVSSTTSSAGLPGDSPEISAGISSGRVAKTVHGSKEMVVRKVAKAIMAMHGTCGGAESGVSPPRVVTKYAVDPRMFQRGVESDASSSKGW